MHVAAMSRSKSCGGSNDAGQSAAAPSPCRLSRVDVERRKPFGSGGWKQSLIRRDEDHCLIPPVLQRQRRGQVDPVEPTKGVALDDETSSTEHVFVETDPQIAGPVSFELFAGVRVVDGGHIAVAIPAGPTRVSICIGDGG